MSTLNKQWMAFLTTVDKCNFLVYLILNLYDDVRPTVTFF